MCIADCQFANPGALRALTCIWDTRHANVRTKDRCASQRQIDHAPDEFDDVSGCTPEPTSRTACQFFRHSKVMIRECLSPKHPSTSNWQRILESRKCDRIDFGLFNLKVYPKLRITFQAININEYTTYTDTFSRPLPKNNYTIPRRPMLSNV